MGNENSNRRRFIRRLVSLAALGGITGLIFGERLEKVSAQANVTTSTTNTSGQIAFWDGGTSITGDNNLRWDNANRNFIAGYSGNAVTLDVVGATISGGGLSYYPNRVTDDYGTVGGGMNNQAGDAVGTTTDARCATVGGGDSNIARGQYATVGGGIVNRASGHSATVGGGYNNEASGGYGATVGGGEGNTASGNKATVGGGCSNQGSNTYATVGGGESNAVSGFSATVGGGARNAASLIYATVGGGENNTASGNSATVGGGGHNTASAIFATVPGGEYNIAAGDYSFAAGRNAKINTAHDGSFLFSDSSNFDFNSSAANEFAVRATGGARFVTAIDGTGAPTRSIVMTPSGNLGVGTSTPTANIHGETGLSDPAIKGVNTGTGVGIRGESSSGYGVIGTTTSTTGKAGVYGYGSGSAIGVRAGSTSGFALLVDGKNYFKSAQRGVIPSGASSYVVTVPAGITIRTAAMIFVTLMSAPNVSVKWVQRLSDTQFKIWLTGTTSSSIVFGYFIVN